MFSTFLFISGTEIAFIIFIVVMVFGADKIPEIARGLGKGMRIVKDATNDIKSEITKSAEKNGINSELPKSVSNNVSEQFKDVKKDLDEITGSVKRTFK
ncbi:twin-arginine translocase TatA/TatE family subunit [Aquimarina sp. ERC-38]|uniref:Sec-independent protein translocase subunit TatA/TatB n=1 Tax=Aquimarina sp. ERC-38 TaxID=2949996 RepID=UPI00224658E5|nr:twin-arginine translocase TatA/TatE family subunit [Aquimarina sp. ERC-38]UZO80795.1 twin-arginine translocase TatA/TatE family subunit [Aquimarina sp. ERC-38]